MNDYIDLNTVDLDYARASLAKGEVISVVEIRALDTAAYAAEVRSAAGDLRAYHVRTFAERIERLEQEARDYPADARSIANDIRFVRDEARRAGVSAAEMEAARV